MRKTQLLAVLVIILLSTGCVSGGLASNTDEEKHQTPAEATNSPTPGTFGATESDATTLETNLSKFVKVDVRFNGGALSVFWITTSPEVQLANVSTGFEDMTQPERELMWIVTYYNVLISNEKINGTVSITAIVDKERVTVWTINERWANQLNSGKMTPKQYLQRIRETRYNL